MNNANLVNTIAGLLQLIVACYALRLNRLFGMSRVGWSLFSAFALLTVLRAFQLMEFSVQAPSALYALVPLLLLIGLIHLETLLKKRLENERETNKVLAQLESRVQERTADLVKANSKLLKEIEERKRVELQMEETHKQLVAASRQAGMAEMAERVLCKIGDMLENVDESANIVAERMKKSKVSNVVNLGGVLREHASDTAFFVKNDPRGQRLPVYLAQLGSLLNEEQASLLKEIDSLKSNLEQIRKVAALQQSLLRPTDCQQRGAPESARSNQVCEYQCAV